MVLGCVFLYNIVRDRLFIKVSAICIRGRAGSIFFSLYEDQDRELIPCLLFAQLLALPFLEFRRFLNSGMRADRLVAAT